MKTVEEFASSLHAARTDMHIAHLQTRKYSDHMALNTFYDEIGDLIDRFIEGYQGRYELIKGYTIKLSEGVDPLKYLQEFVSGCEEYRTICKDGYLQQIVDDIIELATSTIYKIKFLTK